METKAAIKEIIRLSIKMQADPDFVDSVGEGSGFTIFTNSPLWRHVDRLTSRAANGELFPSGGPDEVAFLEVFENYGHAEARRWLTRRLKQGRLVPVTGRKRDGNTQTIVYIPVGSALERQVELRPGRRETVRLMEE